MSQRINVCLSYSILYLQYKCYSKIPNYCPDVASLLQGILIWATLYVAHISTVPFINYAYVPLHYPLPYITHLYSPPYK